ncbi:MAG: extracellular solute-binding protein [Candidatus Dormibacteraeota bacterium]|nr:extracellular solute-binding protein [Candidatus Dormibacteraeota bacterium]
MLTRREFNRAGVTVALGATVATLLDACGFAGGGSSSSGSSSSGAKYAVPKSANLQIAWWGGSNRAQRTQQVMDLMKQQQPGWTMAGQFTSFTDYWVKMNTQAASSSLPDVMQMDMAYIGRYSSQKELLDLSKYRTDPLKLGDFDKGQLSQGTVGGKLVGISLGGNIDAINFNKSAIQQAGMSPPAEDITWEKFASYCSNLAKKLPSGMYPLDDGSGSGAPFEVFLRQRRGEQWTKDGKLNYKSSDVQDWFQWWADLRKAKVVIPGDMAAAEATNGTPAGSTIATGKAVFLMTWSNFIGQYQILMKDEVAMMRDPQGGSGTQVGDYVKASQLFSVPATSQQADAAIEFISFFIHNPAAVKALGVERGVPGSAAARAVLKPTLTPYDAAQIAFLDQNSKLTRAKTVLDPPGAGDVGTALTNAAQSIALSGTSVADATSKFMEDAHKALST